MKGAVLYNLHAMKYWIFQNNQVLGPYGPDDLSKMSAFSPESLVCSEGRRGTSMGDWQRAGMVPDLSVALVRAGSSKEGKTTTLSIAGLPPEPTLKDLAALGSIQEKVAMLEDMVLRLQDGLRAKDAQITTVHGESAELHREAEMLKRQLTDLEERLASVRLLGETLDKAVEEEKRVEHDVEKQGQRLNKLAHEVEDLSHRLEEVSPAHAVAPADVLADAAPMSASIEPLAPEPAPAPGATPAPGTGKKALILGAALGVGALAALAVMGNYVPGLRKPNAPAAVLEPAPQPVLPELEPEPEPVPQPTPAPAPDPRQSAIDLAKEWPLPGSRILGRTLEELAPPGGNLSPWMAETLAGGRVQVNYFARGAAPGAPTIAYEFEVGLEEKTLVGRNAAAGSVLTGKAAIPPAPPKPKPVKVKRKKEAATAAPAAPKTKPPQEGALNSLPGDGTKAKDGKAAADESLLNDLFKE